MNLFFKRPLLSALTAFLISSLIMARLAQDMRSAVVYILVLSLAFVASLVLNLNFKKKRRIFSFTSSFALLLALLGAILQFSYFSSQLSLPQRLEGEEIEIEATIKEITYQNGNFYFINAKADKIKGESTDLLFKFEITTKHKLKEGMVFSCKGNIQSTYSLPTDENRFLIIDGCAGSVTDVSDFYVFGEKKSIGSFLSELRNKISARIENSIEGESGALMSALLLGKTDSLDSSVKFDFRRLGISHMLALSGMHLTVMMSIINIFLSKLNLRKRWKTLILLSISLAYVAVSGFSGSILRAAFMLFMASLSFFSRRENDSYTSLFFALSIIILIQPTAVNDVGLWLSFLATFGLLIYSELFSQKLKTKQVTLKKRILQAASVSLWISFFSFLFTLPITALIFGEISLITPISNLLFAFLMNVELVLAFLAPILCEIKLFARICELLGNLIISAVNFLAALNNICISVSYTVFYAALILFFIYMVYLLYGKFKFKPLIIRILSSFLALMLILGICHINNCRKEAFIYSKRDGKNNDEFLIFIDNGKAAVIDFSSESSASLNYVINLLKNENIIQISSYVFTDYHYRLESSLEKATSKIKIDKVFFPMPNDDADISYVKSAVNVLKNRKTDFEFYENNKKIYVDGFRDFVFYLEAPDFPLYENEYIFALKFKQNNFIYAPPAVTTDVFVKFSDKTDILILGNHGQSCSYPISCALPSDLSHLISSNGEAEYSYDFFYPITDKTKVHTDSLVRLNLRN